MLGKFRHNGKQSTLCLLPQGISAQVFCRIEIRDAIQPCTPRLRLPLCSTDPLDVHFHTRMQYKKTNSLWLMINSATNAGHFEDFFGGTCIFWSGGIKLS